MQHKSVLTGIDKLLFVSKQAPDEYRKLFRSHRKHLKQFFCDPAPNPDRIFAIKSDDELYQQGYRSQILLTRIKPYHQNILWDYCIANNFDFGKPQCIEIFNDAPAPSEQDAIDGVYYVSQFIVLKQYPEDFHIFDKDDPNTWSKNPHQQTKSFLREKRAAIEQSQHPEKFGPRTYYWGKQNYFQLVIYPRHSKFVDFMNVPMVHSEFRFEGDAIRKILHLKKGKNNYLDGLKTLPDFDSIFLEHTHPLVIDEFKYAKHDFGMACIKKITQSQQSQIQAYLERLKVENSLFYAASWVKFIRKNGHRYDRYSTIQNVER